MPRSMAGRTFAIGDIHGELMQLKALMAKLPKLDAEDTVVFLGDYIDRGPHSKQVVEYVRYFPKMTNAKVVALRGNHEDAWLYVRRHGWPDFVRPPTHGCLAAYRSFVNAPVPADGQDPIHEERPGFESGRFFPTRIVKWLEGLPYWYEDQHAIYVHAGLPRLPDGRFAHPRDLPFPPTQVLWLRDQDFFRNYRGKRVVFGHTNTDLLPPELSSYTPEDPKDLWAYENVIGIDTGCGRGGFLTALELPALKAYESR
jgi:serine/threonine protein phosphatase 1